MEYNTMTNYKKVSVEMLYRYLKRITYYKGIFLSLSISVEYYLFDEGRSRNVFLIHKGFYPNTDSLVCERLGST